MMKYRLNIFLKIFLIILLMLCKMRMNLSFINIIIIIIMSRIYQFSRTFLSPMPS